jgi:hypothetical protein
LEAGGCSHRLPAGAGRGSDLAGVAGPRQLGHGKSAGQVGQPYETPLDILRRDAGNDFDEVERGARELNEKIDAGTLEESDI